MLPWKSLVRSAGVVTLLTAGIFTAGPDVVPFSHVSRSGSPPAEVDEPTVEEEAPAVDPDPVELLAEESTTTTDEPETDAPDGADPDDDADDAGDVEDALADPPVVVDVPAERRIALPTQAARDEAREAKPAKDAVRPEKQDRKVKGDHNCDGHPDNGWHNKERPVCPTPPATAHRPDPAKPEKGERPETAPGQLRKTR